MTALSTITDRLVDLLPRLSRTSGIVDEAARMGQYPSESLVRSVGEQAAVLEGVALDLAGIGHADLARTIGSDAITMAKKGGIMHAMNEHQNWFASSWRGSMQGIVNHVQDAVHQLT